jgi:DNA-binding LytR/AlgR family response regulator
MINTLIIEDEKTAADNLMRLLKLTKEPVTISAVLDSVEESVNWFNGNRQPDLVFMDIHLKDGNSFSIFERVSVTAPIVFITAYDNYLVKAFEQNSIEFLLKPIDEISVLHTINKYKKLKQHFINRYDEVAVNLAPAKKRQRLIVKKGIEYQSVLLEDVAYFFTEHKVTFLVTKQEKKFMLDQNLKELEEELDKKIFYRANRKYIINIDCIKSYRTFEKVKLIVDLTLPMSEDIIISQENAGDFKRWMSEV